MDDKSPNSTSQSNIDDLVKELSRPQSFSSSPQTTSPANPIPQQIPARPAPLQSATIAPPKPVAPAPLSTPKPVPPTQPITPPAPIKPVAPSVPKEYQSSIRTMSDDLAKLKSGQQPQGVNVPRKIENVPAPIKPVVPVNPAPTGPSKPSPTVTLPSATKAAPLPYSSAPSGQSVPKTPLPTPSPSPRVVMPPATKAPLSKLDSSNQFYVPPAGEAKPSAPINSRSLLFIGAAVAVVVLGGLFWYFMIYNSGGDDTALESPIATFTPRPTATPNQDILSLVFGSRGGTITLPSSGDPSTAFANAVSAQNSVTPGNFVAVDITTGASVSAQTFNVTTLLDRFLAAYPPALKTSLGSNYRFLLYGQKESFDKNGKPSTISSGQRLVIVSEIASSSAGILQGWEPTMSSNLAGVMSITPAKNTGPFSPVTHNGTSIRFKNFPFPDRSIDYSLMTYNDKTYLIIAGSREAMFATVDALMVPGK